MHKLFIDANIILDVLQKREPHYRDSLKLWKLCEIQAVEGYVSSLTFANIAYIMRKELTPEKIEQVFGMLSLIFHFVDLTAADLAKAIKMRWHDFEDAIQAAMAERIRADYIVTRNPKDFKESRIITIDTTEFLGLINS